MKPGQVTRSMQKHTVMGMMADDSCTTSTLLARTPLHLEATQGQVNLEWLMWTIPRCLFHF